MGESKTPTTGLKDHLSLLTPQFGRLAGIEVSILPFLEEQQDIQIKPLPVTKETVKTLNR